MAGPNRFRGAAIYRLQNTMCVLIYMCMYTSKKKLKIYGLLLTPAAHPIFMIVNLINLISPNEKIEIHSANFPASSWTFHGSSSRF